MGFAIFLLAWDLLCFPFSLRARLLELKRAGKGEMLCPKLHVRTPSIANHMFVVNLPVHFSLQINISACHAMLCTSLCKGIIFTLFSMTSPFSITVNL